MALTVDGNGDITVEVNADADAGAKEVQDAFASALARAMNDPRVRKAVTTMVQDILKSFQQIPKTTNKAWSDTVKGATKAAKAMTDAFNKVGKAATNATKFPSGTNQSFNTLTAHIEAMANNMEELSRATRIQRDLLLDLAKNERLATRTSTQEARDKLQAAAQEQRLLISNQQAQANALRASSTQRVALLRAFSRQAIQIERSLTRVFELTWKSAERAVRGFVNIAGQALRGLGRTVSTIFSGLSRTISTFATGASRALTTIGRGVGSALSGVSRAIASALRRDENAFRQSMSRRERALTQSLSRQAQAQQRFQAQQQSGILGGLGLAGAAGGLSVGALLSSGFTRAAQEESLQLQFATLLQDGGKATRMLQQISDYARTTRFDFVEVAGSVAQLTAAFGDADRAFSTVEFLSDLVSLTGGGTQQFSAARLAFSQIAASGRLEGQELNQLLESIPGVPLVSILADRFFGGDQAAFQKARRDGDLGGAITADAFFEALQEGASARFPELEGFSQKVGKSLGGLADNLRENFAIFGSEIVSLVEGPLKRGMNALNEFLSTAGGFISGSMFTRDQTNPFADLAATDPNAEVNITDLPQAAQDVLRAQFGFTDENFVSAEDAAEIWENFAPPPEINERLKEFRDVLGDSAKAIGGFLALAGGAKILRLALIALTSPLGLVVIAGAAFGALFNRLNQFNSFKAPLLGLKAAFGGLAEAVGGVFSFLLEIGSGKILGSSNFFKSLADRVGNFLNVIRRGVRALTDWVKMFEFFLRIGEGGRFLADTIQDIGRAIGNLGEDIATSLFGIGFGEAMFAEARGGNDFLNLLETTFLGPVVRFFRGPFADGVEGLGGFVGDLFNGIFGDSAPGGGKQLASEGRGSRILDVLESTFLGPIVRFFRGPFSDALEGFGGFIGDLFNAVFGDDAGGIGTRILNVLNNTFLGPIVRFFRGPFANGVEAVAGFVVDLFRTIVDGIQSFLSLIEPFTDAVGNFFAGLFGAGDGASFGDIWTGLSDSLGNITDKVAEILDPVWDAITGWFADTFTAENMIAFAQAFLEFVREAGRIIGSLVTSKYVLAAVLGIAAVAASLVGAFVLGFGEAAFQNAKEIGSIIINMIGDALGGLNLSGLPGISLFTGGLISAIVGALAVGIAASAIGPTLISGIGAVMNRKPGKEGFLSGATAFAGGILSSVGGALKNAFSKEGSGLFGIISRAISPKKGDAGINASADATANSFVNRVGTALKGAGKTLATVGRNAAAAIAGGAAGFGTGYLVAKGGGSLLEQILGVGGLALGIGAINVPAGIAAGALGVLGVVMGNTAREAKESAARVADLASALQGFTGGDLVPQLSSLISQNLFAEGAGALEDWGGALADADFDFQNFAQQIVDGTATADSSFADFLGGLRDDLVATGEVSQEQADAVIGAFNDAAASGDYTNLSDLLDAVLELVGPEAFGALVDAAEALPDSFTGLLSAGGDAANVFDFLQQNVKEAGRAFELLDTAEALNTLDTTAEAVQAINDALGDGATGEEIADLLSQSDLTSEESLGALRDVATDIRDRISEANDQMRELLDIGVTPTTAATLTNAIVADLPNIASQFQSIFDNVEIAPNVQLAQLEETREEFTQQISDAIADGFESGATDTQPEMDTFLSGLRTQIDEANLPQAVEDELLAIVAQFEEVDYTPVFEAIASALTDQQAIDAAAEEMARRIIEAVTTATGSAGGGSGPLVQGREIGAKVAGEIAAGISESGAIQKALGDSFAGSTTKAQPKTNLRPQSTGVTVDDSGIRDAQRVVASIQAVLIAGVIQAARAATALGEAISSGISSGSRGASNAAANAASNAVSAISVYRIAMFAAGANLTQAMASGIASQASAAANAAANVAAIVAAAARSRLKIRSPSQVFFDIGTQIGQGFVEGIKDSETDMATAISNAIEGAIATGTERAGDAMRKAQVGEAIFGALTPSLIPGGASFASQILSNIQQFQQVVELGTQFRSGGTESLGNLTSGATERATIGINQSILLFQDAFQSIAQEWNDAWHLRAGTNNEGVPQPLSFRQQDILNTGPASLGLGTFAGTQNREAIAQAIQSITEWGQAAITAGSNAGSVVQTMEAWVNALRNTAVGMGFNVDQVNEVINAYGVSSAALEQWRRDLTALDFSAAGLANNVAILQQLEAIREFGSEMLAAGRTTDTVVGQLKQLRDELIRQATGFGFNASEIATLVEQVGLSDSALAAFIQQMRDFETAANNAAAAQNNLAENDRDFVPQPTIQELHVHVPHGDPEAIGVSVLNRLAYELVGVS